MGGFLAWGQGWRGDRLRRSFHCGALSSLGLGLALVLGATIATPDAHAETPTRAHAAGLVATAAPPVLRSFAAEMPTNTVAGFRMEGAPQVEIVFGDIAAYKQHIDRFTFLENQMTEERQRFATATHQVQLTLAHARQARQRRRVCPTDAIAAPVATATESHARFRELGRDLEVTFGVIRDLHQLGESAGLTPDYRGRVLQSRPSYRQALVDLSEMNAVLHKQLEPELARRGCKPEELIAYVAQKTAPAIADETETKSEHVVAKPAVASTVVQARAVTFFIDNRACEGSLDVYVDATLLGHVAAGTHAAFQSLSGRHSLCLLDEGSVASCGDTGTVRTAFMHDGFRIRRSCDSPTP